MAAETKNINEVQKTKITTENNEKSLKVSKLSLGSVPSLVEMNHNLNLFR
jgi:hypothetical protein